jgi:low affinity Fe/Cu permease
MSSSNGKDKSAFERIGCLVSSWVSDVAASPFAQLAVVVICAAWFALGLSANVLTAILSILAISLTQMVLNRQNEREADAHRRDVAMHAKLDELVIASKLARNEMAGIEELEEEEIKQLKEVADQAIEAVEEEPAGTPQRKKAEKVLDVANKKLAESGNRTPKPGAKARRGAAGR